ncbi:MAG: hypothetical protein LBM21_02095 [Coriobacteriales bacterium]|jgi:hypothetical protein|nr:hypothetical protein [Coriobacteriales bacterium]
MFERDYLMRQIMDLVVAIRRSLEHKYKSPEEEIKDIEDSVGDAVNIDSELLLSMDAQSMLQMLEISDIDPKLVGYLVRSLYYVSGLSEDCGMRERAELRKSQADALVSAYGVDIDPDTCATPEELEAFFDEQEEQ